MFDSVQLSSWDLSVVDAALNAGDDEAEARERFSKVANTIDEVEAMILSWRFWREAASR